jgi:hypothetical protein
MSAACGRLGCDMLPRPRINEGRLVLPGQRGTNKISWHNPVHCWAQSHTFDRKYELSNMSSCYQWSPMIARLLQVHGS